MNTRYIGLLAVLAALSCTTDGYNADLTIPSVVLGTASGTPGGACSFTTGTPEVFYPIFNPTAVSNLGLTGFVVKNDMIDTSTLNVDLRGDSTNFNPHQAVVDYEIIGGATLPEQTIPVSSGSVAAGGSTPVGVPLFLPSAIVAALPANGFVRTTTHIEGKLDDGTTVRTTTHEYVVQICSSCPETACF